MDGWMGWMGFLMSECRTAIKQTVVPVGSALNSNGQIEIPISSNNGSTVAYISIEPQSAGTLLFISATNPTLLQAAGSANVVSATLDFSLANIQGSSQSLQGQATICFKTDQITSNGQGCLSYLDVQVNPPVWRCQDGCLTQVSPSFACGTTNHFTDFAVLFEGQSSSNVFNTNGCVSDSQSYIFGSWWKEGILALSVAAFIVGVLVLFSLIVILFPPANRLFYGPNKRRQELINEVKILTPQYA